MKELIPTEVIEQKIFLIGGEKVMLDRDLAVLYGVKTFNLNKAVARNFDRFPSDFMFRLTEREFKNLIFHFGISRWGGTRKRPLVFTEHGILMLSSVLRSKRAAQVNIQIMRAFVKLRKMIASNATLRRKIEAMERKYDAQFRVVFDAIKKILIQEEKPRREIGFHVR